MQSFKFHCMEYSCQKLNTFACQKQLRRFSPLRKWTWIHNVSICKLAFQLRMFCSRLGISRKITSVMPYFIFCHMKRWKDIFSVTKWNKVLRRFTLRWKMYRNDTRHLHWACTVISNFWVVGLQSRTLYNRTPVWRDTPLILKHFGIGNLKTRLLHILKSSQKALKHLFFFFQTVQFSSKMNSVLFS